MNKEDIRHLILHSVVSVGDILVSFVGGFAIESHDTLNGRFEWKDWVTRLAPPLVHFAIAHFFDYTGIGFFVVKFLGNFFFLV